jgi:CHASE3 domain sensor protein
MTERKQVASDKAIARAEAAGRATAWLVLLALLVALVVGVVAVVR